MTKLNEEVPKRESCRYLSSFPTSPENAKNRRRRRIQIGSSARFLYLPKLEDGETVSELNVRRGGGGGREKRFWMGCQQKQRATHI